MDIHDSKRSERCNKNGYFGSEKQKINGIAGLKLGKETRKRKARERKENYEKNPKLCAYCLVPLPYEHHKEKTFCNCRCAGLASFQKRKPESIETRKKRSDTMKRKIASKRLLGFPIVPKAFPKAGKKNLAAYLAEHRICYHLITCKECGKEFKIPERDINTRVYCSNKCRYKNNYHESKRKIYNGIGFDSEAELRLAKYMDSKELTWTKNKKIKFPYIIDGKARNYVPDFYLTDHKVWIEVKGKAYSYCNLITSQLIAVLNEEPNSIIALLPHDYTFSREGLDNFFAQLLLAKSGIYIALKSGKLESCSGFPPDVISCVLQTQGFSSSLAGHVK